MNSDMKFLNVDFVMALRYLRVVGGNDHIREIGLACVAPRWLGTRPDLIAVGGESINEDGKWSTIRRELTEHEVSYFESS